MALIKEREYFLSYKDFHFFKDQTLNSIKMLNLLHGYHLYWPDLDIDLELIISKILEIPVKIKN